MLRPAQPNFRKLAPLILLFVVACNLNALVQGQETGTTPTLASLQVQPAAPLSVQPDTATPTDPSGATLTAVPTSTPIPTSTPSPTPTLHPMSILAERQTPYPGSDIVIEEELEPGPNYHRYYASYLSEGLKIYALLTIPDGEMPAQGWPALVFNHGYIPPDQYRTTGRYISHVDNLARHGYIVFRIDYRGNDRSQGVASGAYGDPGYTTDVLNAVASLKRFPSVNPDRIGMWGHSMGGFLTLRAMVISKDIKAGVIWSGVVASYTDLLCCWDHGRGPTPTPRLTVGRGWRSWMEPYGPPDDNSDFWDAWSANTYLSDVSGPLQLHHGTADEEVPLAFSEALYNQMHALGLPAEFYTYEGGNHNLSNYFSQAMTRTIEFFDRYLKDQP